MTYYDMTFPLLNMHVKPDKKNRTLTRQKSIKYIDIFFSKKAKKKNVVERIVIVSHRSFVS